jgi:hypothetical protein
MMIINYYKIWCATEGMFVYRWSDQPPLCPNNSSHEINLGLTSIEQSIDDSIPLVKMSDVRHCDGRLSVQSTPRPVGTSTVHTGYSDLMYHENGTRNIEDVGNGEIIRLDHIKGGGVSAGNHLVETVYVDFNTILNPSYIFRATILHSNFINSNISCYAVCRHSTFNAAVNSNYMTIPYLNTPNSLVLPVNGNGNCEPDDINNVELIEAAYLADGYRGPGFWNATIDYTAPKGFKDITPAPLGNGQYNIFSSEVKFDRFVNVILDSPGRHEETVIDSFDVSRIPHGLRLKIVIKIPKDSDTTCTAFTNIMMYRSKSI